MYELIVHWIGVETQTERHKANGHLAFVWKPVEKLIFRRTSVGTRVFRTATVGHQVFRRIPRMSQKPCNLRAARISAKANLGKLSDSHDLALFMLFELT